MTFSVVIPTFNRLMLLKETVQSVFHQEFTDFELIIVNDGSTDDTHGYLSELASQKRIVYVQQENHGPAAARNAGLRVACGVYIAFTDDDCVVPSSWLRQFMIAFEDRGIDLVGGVVRNCVSNNFYAEISQAIVNHFVLYLNTKNAQHGFFTSNNIAYRVEALHRVGGFDERFVKAGGEERAVNYAILSGGGRSALLHDCVVNHYHAMTMWSFFRQQRNYGRGSYVLYHMTAEKKSSTTPIIPFAAYLELLLSWLKHQPVVGVGKIIVFFVAQCMVVLGFAQEAIAPRRNLPLRVA